MEIGAVNGLMWYSDPYKGQQVFLKKTGWPLLDRELNDKLG